MSDSNVAATHTTVTKVSMTSMNTTSAARKSVFRVKVLLLWFALAAAVVFLDQVTKVWADSALRYDPMVFTSFFKFDLAYNTGAAFSFLHWGDGWQRWLFAAIAAGVSVFISVWIAMIVKQQKPGRHWELCALSLVLGGAVGNLIDRLVYGHVIDFISVHYQQYHFPTFNLADSAICVGAALLIFDMLFVQGKTAAPSKDDIDRVDSHV